MIKSIWENIIIPVSKKIKIVILKCYNKVVTEVANKI